MYQSYIESLCAQTPPKDFSRHPHGEFIALVKTVKAGEAPSGKPFHEIVFETEQGQPKSVRVWGFSKADEQLAGHDHGHRSKVMQQIEITKGQLVRWGLCTSEHIARQGWTTPGGVVDQLASMIGRSFKIVVGPDRKDPKYDATEIQEMIPGVLLPKQQPPQHGTFAGPGPSYSPPPQQQQQQHYQPPQAVNQNLDQIPF